jgi:hypothetical protein
MPRPRRRATSSGSLFPFLSVLACVIGTLTLLIAALAIGQVASDLESDRSHGELEDPSALTARRDAVARLRRQVAEARSARHELARLRADLLARGIEPDLTGNQLAAAVAAAVDQARLAAQVATLEAQQEELLSAIDAARLHLDRLPEPQPNDSTITLQPSGRGPPLAPFFVECRRDTIRLHSPDQDWSIPLYLNEADDRSRFDRFLSGVREVPNATVVLLLRPDGVDTYQRAQRILLSRSIRHGKLPLPGNGAIDFRLVRGGSPS